METAFFVKTGKMASLSPDDSLNKLKTYVENLNKIILNINPHVERYFQENKDLSKVSMFYNKLDKYFAIL